MGLPPLASNIRLHTSSRRLLLNWVRLYNILRPSSRQPMRRRKLALFVRRSFHRLSTTDYRLPATCHCERSAAITTPRGTASRQSISLPMGRVARIVPEFCAQTAPKNGANPCSHRNKEFFACRVFYLLDCCTNVIVFMGMRRNVVAVFLQRPEMTKGRQRCRQKQGESLWVSRPRPSSMTTEGGSGSQTQSSRVWRPGPARSARGDQTRTER